MNHKKKIWIKNITAWVLVLVFALGLLPLHLVAADPPEGENPPAASESPEADPTPEPTATPGPEADPTPEPTATPAPTPTEAPAPEVPVVTLHIYDDKGNNLDQATIRYRIFAQDTTSANSALENIGYSQKKLGRKENTFVIDLKTENLDSKYLQAPYALYWSYFIEKDKYQTQTAYHESLQGNSEKKIQMPETETVKNILRLTSDAFKRRSAKLDYTIKVQGKPVVGTTKQEETVQTKIDRSPWTNTDVLHLDKLQTIPWTQMQYYLQQPNLYDVSLAYTISIDSLDDKDENYKVYTSEESPLTPGRLTQGEQIEFKRLPMLELHLDQKGPGEIKVEQVNENGSTKARTYQDGDLIEMGRKLELTAKTGDEATIKSIKISGQDQTVDGKTIKGIDVPTDDFKAYSASYNKTFTMDSSKTLSVEMVPQYIVKVHYNENGQIEQSLEPSDPALFPESDLPGQVETTLEGRTLQDQQLTIKATPSEHYRVLEVTVDGKAEVQNGKPVGQDDASKNFYTGEKPYERILEANRNHDLSIRFAPFAYDVKAEDRPGDPVQITVGDKATKMAEVDYGEAVEIYFSIARSYDLSEISINGVPIHETEYKDAFSLSDDRREAVLSIKPVTENLTISAQTVRVQTPQRASLRVNGKPLYEDAETIDGAYYYFINPSNLNGQKSITISSTDPSIKGIVAEGYKKDSNKPISYGSQSNPILSIAEDVEIRKITFYQQRYVWFVPYLEPITVLFESDSSITISVEENAPEVSFRYLGENGSTDLYYEKDKDTYYYNQTVQVEVMVKEEAISSGLESVEYSILKDGTVLEGYQNIKVDLSAEEKYEKRFTVDIPLSYEISTQDATKIVGATDIQVEVKAEDQLGNRGTVRSSFISLSNPTSVYPEARFDLLAGSGKLQRASNGSYVTNESLNFRLIIDDKPESLRLSEDGSDSSSAGRALHVNKFNPASKQYEPVELDPDPNLKENWHEVDEDGRKVLAYDFSLKSEDGSADGLYEVNFMGYRNIYGTYIYNQSAGKASYSAGAQERFIIDTLAPTGSFVENIPTANFLEELLIRFGIIQNKPIKTEVKIAEPDSTQPTTKVAPVKAVRYYVYDVDQADAENHLKFSDLQKLADSAFVEDVPVLDKNQRAVVYAKLEDEAGNIRYIGSDGLIFDQHVGALKLVPLFEGNEHGFYNKDLKVRVEATDKIELTDETGQKTPLKANSGIRKIYWEVLENGKRAPNFGGDDGYYRLADFSANHPSKGELMESFVTTDKNHIMVYAEKHNSDDVVLRVYLEDNAGNTTHKDMNLKISAVKPEATIFYEDTIGELAQADAPYFNKRTLYLEVKDSDFTFDKDAFEESLELIATDGQGRVINVDPISMFGDWTSKKDADGNVIQQTTLTFDQDANYEIKSWKYTNLAGNTLELNDIKTRSFADHSQEAAFPRHFTVDKTQPWASLSLDQNTWSKFLETITFGLYKNTEETLLAGAGDKTSPYRIHYYVDHPTQTNQPYKGLSVEELNQLDESLFLPVLNASGEETWKGPVDTIKLLTLKEDQQSVVYLRVVDYAGNLIYINTDGFVWDQTMPEIQFEKIPAKDKPYNQDFDVKLHVAEGPAYSGLKEVEVWLYTKGKMEDPQAALTYRETLYDFTKEQGTAAVKFEDLKADFEDTVRIIAKDNDSNETYLYIRALDNAGNERLEVVPLSIDVTAPKVSLAYDNNDDHIPGAGFFQAPRKATLTVLERPANFDEAKATEGIQITAVDKNGRDVEDAYTIGQWRTVENSEDPDLSAHTIEISFAKDADYSLDFSYTDEAGNPNEPINTGDSHSPFAFNIDTVAPSLALDKDIANQDIFNRDVQVFVETHDGMNRSGINRVDYWVINNGKTTQSGSLFESKNPTLKNTEEMFEGSIRVDAQKNNGFATEVKVRVTDNAGNVTEDKLSLVIDIMPPEIEVRYDNNQSYQDDKYFNRPRKATVTIYERPDHFDADDADRGLVITAVDGAGQAVSNTYEAGAWITIEDKANPDRTRHQKTILYKGDANYTFAISYTDKAGNPNEGMTVLDSVHPYDFAVDKNKPAASLTAETSEGKSMTWDRLWETIRFGLWSQNSLTIRATGSDLTVPVSAIYYYKYPVPHGRAMTYQELEKLTDKDWTLYKPFQLTEDEKVSVYIKVVDRAGNYTYANSQGLIIDKTAPKIDDLSPKISFTGLQNGIYNTDVPMGIEVIEPMVNNSYSGLAQVRYAVYSGGNTEPTQQGVLYSFDKAEPSWQDLRQSWSGSITIDSRLNNSNDVRVEVVAVDNTGNQASRSETVKIDITAPVITVRYDNNQVQNGHYFQSARTATVSVRERNFNPAKVQLKVTNSDGPVPAFTNWTSSGSGDNTVWTSYLKYGAEGDYTFDIAFMDEAGNRAGEVRFADGTLSPKEFTIDLTRPVMTLTYDNNEAENGNYYNKARTAYITIVERNFNPEKYQLIIEADMDGQSVGLPTLSGWSTTGQTHRAEIRFEKDAFYRLNMAYVDEAGNAAENFKADSFYIDKKAPIMSISGVEDQRAYDGKLEARVLVSDWNLLQDGLSISLKGAKQGILEAAGDLVVENQNGSFTLAAIPEEKDFDDIYTLTAKARDKAGNMVERQVTFSINRFGSTYELSEATLKMNGAYLTHPEDVVVQEINPNALGKIQVTLFKNGQPVYLEEGKDYELTSEGGKGKWYVYTYRIFKSLFEEDGVYSLSFYSEDEAGNISENSLESKNIAIQFGVDRIEPELNIQNLRSNQTYASDLYQVRFKAEDNFILKSVRVYLDGESFSSWEGDRLAQVIDQGGLFEFGIPGTSTKAHDIRIVAVDAAGNSYEETLDNVYVTMSLWIRYLTNRPLFYGSMAILILLLALVIFLVVKRSREQDKSELSKRP